MLQFYGQFVLDKMRIQQRETYRDIHGVLLAHLVRKVGHEFVVACHRDYTARQSVNPG